MDGVCMHACLHSNAWCQHGADCEVWRDEPSHAWRLPRSLRQLPCERPGYDDPVTAGRDFSDH